MNESTLTQLKILVERAVRPVRASTGRKRKMREELLAHVSAVFAEEAKLGGESDALQRTEQRFGNPGELTAQLQESVPFGDYFPWFVETLVGFPARESTLRRAIRHAAVIGGASTVYVAVAILASSNRSEWLTTARAPPLYAAFIVAFLIFSGTLITGAMRRALYGPGGRSWFLAGVVSVAALLFIPATMFAFCVAFSGDVAASFWDVVPSVPAGVLAPVGLALLVVASDAEVRYDQEWSSLPIDGVKGATA